MDRKGGEDEKGRDNSKKHDALSQLAQQVEQKYRDEQQKVNELRTKQSLEKAHATYLRSTYGGSAVAGYARGYGQGQGGSRMQSSVHGARTIGIDARVQLGNAIVPSTSTGAAPPFSSPPFSSPAAAPPSPAAHPSTWSVSQRIQQEQQQQVVVAELIPTPHDEPLLCPIINCEVSVPSRRELEEHLAGCQHSPCNPCRHINTPAQFVYACPVCLLNFKSPAECDSHMVSSEHKVLMTPVTISAYACPQCIMLFSTRDDCNTHINTYSHHQYTYAFKDDESRTHGQPVPMPRRVVHDFRRFCYQVSWSLECTDCEKLLNGHVGRKALPLHLQQKHFVMSTTDFTPSEVFGMHMMKPYTCVQCLRLADSLPNGDCVHKCRDGIMGMYVDSSSDCSSFEQYVIRYSLPDLGNRQPESSASSSSSSSFTATSSTSSSSASVIELDSPGQRRPPPQATKTASESSLSAAAAPCTGLQRTDNAETHRGNSCEKLPQAAAEDTGSRGEKRKTSNDSLGGQTVSKKSKPRSTEQLIDLSESLDNSEIAKALEGFTIIDDISPEKTGKKRKSDEMEKGSSAKMPYGLNSWQKLAFLGENTLPKCVADLPVSPPSAAVVVEDDSDVEEGAEKEVEVLQVISKLGKRHGWERDSRKDMAGTSRSLPGASIVAPRSPSRGCQTELYVSPGSPSAACQTDRISAPRSPSTSSQTDNPTTSSTTHHSPPLSSPVYSLTPPSSPSHLPRPDPCIPQGLETMELIVFLDLDNWGGFWKKLPQPLPDGIFVWGFYGGHMTWHEPKCYAFDYAKSHGYIHIHKKCGSRKDAADFAICLMVGKLDERLSKHIPFVILSGDAGFLELEAQMTGSQRRAIVINPHHKQQDEIYLLIKSVHES